MTVHVYSQFGWDLDALTKAMEPLKQSFQDIQYAMMNMCVGPTQKELGMGDKTRIWDAKTDGVRCVLEDLRMRRRLVLTNDLPRGLRDSQPGRTGLASEFAHEIGICPLTNCYRTYTPLTWVDDAKLAEAGLGIVLAWQHACIGRKERSAHPWTSWYREEGNLCEWCAEKESATGQIAAPLMARPSTEADWNGIIGNVVEISRARTVDGKTVFYETQLGLCVGPGQVRFLRHMRLGEPVQLPLNAYIQHDGVNPTGWRCRYWILKENDRAPEVADVLLALSMEKSTQRDLGWDPYPTGSI